MKKGTITLRILSALICAMMLITTLPFAAVAARGTQGSYASVYGGTNNKIADPGTVNDWKEFFGPEMKDTTNAGAVWSDKSVFNSVEEYLAATDEADDSIGLSLTDPNNFLVALSTIASSKSVEGFSTLPSDTILVLDLSASMIDGTNYVTPMVQAANSAITKLQELNANNRVGVVAYSYEDTAAEVILPLGRYTAGLDGNNQSAYLLSSWTTGSGWNRQSHTGIKVANGVTGTVAEGVSANFSTNNSRDAEGGTFIQAGLYTAWEMMEDVEDTAVAEGIQAGIERTPVMVLLSDGAPTQASNNYTNVGDPTHGDGTANYSTTGVSFLTQLTAAHLRDQMEKKYNADPLFYTLGLGVGNNASAKNVLDPANNTETDDLWADFIALANNSQNNRSMQVLIRDRSGNNNDEYATVRYTDPVLPEGWTQDYVNEYFPASNTAGLIQAFEDIVEHIIIQSLYYPTLVSDDNINHDGFLEFEDYIGKGMDVKAVKGIQLGSTLYDGHTIAKLIYDGGMGSVEDPTDVGNNMVWAVMSRMGIENVQTARDLIGSAYRDGQLFYDPTTGEYSNYIGWYGDAQGRYIGYWNGEESSLAEAPANAVFANKSYGYYDAVGEGHRKTDMMYATILVRKTIKDDPANPDASEVGDIRLIGKIPASLIPLVEYEITLDGMDPMNPATMTISGATAPSRLLYEVGLSDEVDLLDLANTAPANKQADGTYVFYTNQWQDITAPGYYYDYTTDKNTIAFFSPSEENERYYYNADTPIYSDTNGTPYTGDAAPTPTNGTYYHRFIIYKQNGSLTAQYAYEAISEHVLTEHDHLYRAENDQWFVKRGTIHHYYGDYTITKADNATKTLNVSDMPFVHDPEQGIWANVKDEYHVDSYLGNNGKLVLDPMEGIKIQKIADASIEDRNQLYTFDIVENELAGTVKFTGDAIFILEDAEGNRTENTISFVNGATTLQIKTGETAYIISKAMEGRTFNVKEDVPDGIGYQLYRINDATANLQEGINLFADTDTIAGATFVNTDGNHPPKVYEPINVSISGEKTLNSNIRNLQAGAFAFELVDKESGNVIRRVANAAPTTDDTAPFTFSLSFETEGTHTYILREVVPQENGTSVYQKDGMTYDNTAYEITVTVTDVNNALVANVQGADGIIFENSYAVAPTGITIEGDKTLVGDAISNHTGEKAFEFALYSARWDYNSQSVVKGSLIGTAKNDANGNFAFDSATYSTLRFTTTGAHRYILEEVIPAEPVERMTYDRSYYQIEVDVLDDFMGGLETEMAITKIDANGVSTAVSAINFVNIYAPEPITVPVAGTKTYTKELTDGLFTFELYQALKDAAGAINPIGDPVLYASNDANGDFAFADEGTTYLTFDRTGTYYFTVKESIPEDAVNNVYKGITYDPTVYTLTVVINEVINNEGRTELTYTLHINGSNQGSIAFANTYDASAKEGAILTGRKTLTGKDIANDMFTFELYEATMDDQRNVTIGNKLDEVQNIGNAFSFTEIEYTSLADAKTHFYVIKEQIPTDAINNMKEGMTYDDTAYLAEVTVEDNNDGTLLVNAPVYYEIHEDGKAAGASQAMVISNEYEASSDKEVLIGGTKKLTGKTLQDDMFTFELYAATLDGENNVQIGEKIDTAHNQGEGFAFKTVTYKTVQNVGIHYYAVKEHIPVGADENHVLGNVTYDASSYLVKVEVNDNGNGTLNVSDPVYYEISNGKPTTAAPEGPIFENIFTPTAITYTLGGQKILLKDDIAVGLNDMKFNFALYETDRSYAIPEDAQPKIVQNANSGQFTFAPIPATEATTKYYVIKEQASPYEKIDTDLTVYHIQVDIINTDGVLSYETTIRVGEKVVETVEFTNCYKPEPQTPQNPPAEPPVTPPAESQKPQEPSKQPQAPTTIPNTGEGGTLLLWLAMMLASGAGLLTLGSLKKKKESE